MHAYQLLHSAYVGGGIRIGIGIEFVRNLNGYFVHL